MCGVLLLLSVPVAAQVHVALAPALAHLDAQVEHHLAPQESLDARARRLRQGTDLCTALTGAAEAGQRVGRRTRGERATVSTQRAYAFYTWCVRVEREKDCAFLVLAAEPSYIM